MKRIFIIVCLLTMSTTAYADDISFGSRIDPLEFKGAKELDFAYANDVSVTGNVLSWKVGGGLLIEDNIFGYKHNPYGEFAIRIKIKTHTGLYCSAEQGVAYMVNIQQNLDTRWQLPTTLSAGLSTDKFFMGASFKHFSNGTVSGKNLGRNYIGLDFGFSI